MRQSKRTRTLGRLEHGDFFDSRTLGRMSVLTRSSTFSSGFHFTLSVQKVALGTALLLLNKDFFFVIEHYDATRMSVLLPVGLVKPLAVEAGLLSEPHGDMTLDDLVVLRLGTSELVQPRPNLMCYRDFESRADTSETNAAGELCVYQVLTRQESLDVLEQSLNRLLDFSLMLWEQGVTSGKSVTNNLARTVESHRY